MIIRKQHLLYAAKVNPTGLIRLAKFLNLRIDGLSIKHIARLIWWRITRK